MPEFRSRSFTRRRGRRSRSPSRARMVKAWHVRELGTPVADLPLQQTLSGQFGARLRTRTGQRQPNHSFGARPLYQCRGRAVRGGPGRSDRGIASDALADGRRCPVILSRCTSRRVACSRDSETLSGQVHDSRPRVHHARKSAGVVPQSTGVSPDTGHRDHILS